MNLNLFSHTISVIGMILIVVAYLLVVAEKISSSDFSFSAINLLGAALLFLSLLIDFNLGAIILEGFWIIISAYGLFKWYQRKI